jgi:quercetin dioxygenase-like cupin family protein
MGEYHDDVPPGGDTPDRSGETDLGPVELVAAPLVLMAPPVAPSPGLFDRIAAAAGIAPDLPGHYVCRSGDGVWQPVADGIDMRVLYRGGPGERRTVLLRMQPGSTVAAHRHHADEECFVLEGEVRMGAMSFGRGDYLIARGGSDHPPVTSPTGSLLLISTQVPGAAAHP